MLRKGLLFIFNFLLLALICLPLLQRKFDLFPRKKLINVTVSRKPPIFNKKRFFNGGFQRGFERWFMQTSGFWGALTTTNNQINYQIFEELSSHYTSGHVFMVGNDYSLYQGMMLRDFNGDYKINRPALAKLVTKIGRLQRYMESRGKTVIVLISANKLPLQPDYVPARHVITPRGRRYIDDFRELAAAEGLNFLDTGRELLEFNRTQNYPVFAAQAAHWNSPSACFVSQRLLEIAAERLRKPLNKLDCSQNHSVSPRPLGADKDLVEVINVWTPGIGFKPTPYVKSQLQPASTFYDPRMLYVGTSFLWSVFDNLEKVRAYSERDFFYYGKTNHFSYRGADGKAQRGSKGVKFPTLDWQAQVFDKDVIVLEVNESRLPELGFKFVPRALKALKALEPKKAAGKKKSLKASK